MSIAESPADTYVPSRRLQFDTMFREAVTGMAVIGLDGRYKSVNDALCRLLGYPKEQLLGRRPADITHAGDRQQSISVMARLLSGSISADQAQKRYLRADGSTVYVMRTTTVLRDPTGAPAGLFTQVVDLTGLQDAQESLHQSERRFRALVAHASDLTLLVDGQGRITYSSPSSLRVLGYVPEELEGLSCFDFLHPDDLIRARASFGRHLATTGPSDPVTYQVRHRDRSWRQVEVMTTNLFSDPAVDALVLNIRDITEQAAYQARIEASERRFRALVGNSWDIISLHDIDGRYLYCSPAVAQLGYDPDELTGTDPYSLIHADDSPVRNVFRELAAGAGRSATYEYRVRHRDGSWRWVESVGESRLDDPAIAAVVVTTRDVTLRRQRATQQGAVAALGAEALKGGPVEGLLERIPRMVSEALDVPHCMLVRFESCDSWAVVGTTTPEISDRLFSPGAACTVAVEAVVRRRSVVCNDSQAAGGRHPGLGPMALTSAVAVPVRPAGGPAGVLSVYSPAARVFSGDDVAFLESVANILATALSRRQIEDELRSQAVHDSLTGLRNRVLLLDRLGLALKKLERSPGSVAVLFVDVDNFKLVNDSLGHSVGDSVVAAVASRLSGAVRATDTVARFGGDEFVIIVDDTDQESARSLAQRLREEASAPIHLGAGPISVTVSIGFVVTADPTSSPEALLADADMAMYDAKQAGKDSIAAFVPELRKRTVEQMETVSGIRRGIRDREFRVFYQPIVDLASRSVAGHEALIRWEHPTAGLLTPDHFIDYAEESGLIVALGEFVLRTACEQSVRWKQAGAPSHVSVNVSGVQLTATDMVSIVRAAVEDSGAVPTDISLEVTESAVMSDLERARITLEGLRALGIHLGMDDFGTGWSSLSHLANLPFDFIKIDRSFVRDLRQEGRPAAMLESMLALCGALRLRVVVEGVETPWQLEQLTRLDVRFVQGFLFGRPALPRGDRLTQQPGVDGASRRMRSAAVDVAGVDGNHRPGDVAGIVRNQPEDGVGDVDRIDGFDRDGVGQ